MALSWSGDFFIITDTIKYEIINIKENKIKQLRIIKKTLWACLFIEKNHKLTFKF